MAAEAAVEAAEREGEDEAKHTSSLPRFGPHGCVKPYSCFVVCIELLLGSVECYSTPQQLTRPSVSVLSSSLIPCAWASFYMLKGSPTGGNIDKGKNGKVLRLVKLPATVYLLGLDTLSLNGSKGTTEDLGGHPASLAAGCCDCPCTSSGY